MSKQNRKNAADRKKEGGENEKGGITLESSVLDGFDLETKLRKDIYSLLKPVSDKQADVQKRVMEMQITLIDQHEERLMDLESTVLQSDKPTTMFELIEDRCVKIDTSWRENYGIMDNTLTSFRKEVDDLKWHLTALKDDLSSSNGQI